MKPRTRPARLTAQQKAYLAKRPGAFAADARRDPANVQWLTCEVCGEIEGAIYMPAPCNTQMTCYCAKHVPRELKHCPDDYGVICAANWRTSPFSASGGAGGSAGHGGARIAVKYTLKTRKVQP